MRYDQKMLAAWQACVAFNDDRPLGTKVIVQSTVVDEGKQPKTVTRESVVTGPARAMANGSAVVSVKGFESLVGIDRVSKV